MHRVKANRDMRISGFGSVVCAAVAAVILGGSCSPDTETTLCEITGQRCPPGFSCSADQTGCIQDSCGNADVEIGEMCDDGNVSNTDACVGSCVTARCGDGYVQAGVEQCDDGNTVTEECLYGNSEGMCKVCNKMCQFMDKSIPYCGDGIVQFLNGENCDDHNSTVCGTCSTDCKAFQLAYSTGQIVVVARDLIMDSDGDETTPPVHDTFTLNDGINPPVTFEFDKDNKPSIPGHILVSVANASSVENVRDAVKDAINMHHSLLMSAFTMNSMPNIVILKNMRPTGLGNQDIIPNVTHMNFSVMGMRGGAGADCVEGIGCKSDSDCRTNVCLPNDTCGCMSEVECPWTLSACVDNKCVLP